MNDADDIEHILGIIMAQKYTLKVCYNILEKWEEYAVSPELTHIHDIERVVQIYTSKISRKDTEY